MSGIAGPEHGGIGGDLFAATLQLLADKDAVEKRIAEYQSAKQQAEAVLALVGPANEVLALREKARADREEAAKVLADARTETEAMLVDARRRLESVEKETDALLAEQKKLLTQAKQDVASVHNEAAARLAAAVDAQKQAETMQMLANDAKKKAEVDTKAALAMKDEYEQRMKSLSLVIEQFRGSLGGV